LAAVHEGDPRGDERSVAGDGDLRSLRVDLPARDHTRCQIRSGRYEHGRVFIGVIAFECDPRTSGRVDGDRRVSRTVVADRAGGTPLQGGVAQAKSDRGPGE
jgi:hypothetical protein